MLREQNTALAAAGGQMSAETHSSHAPDLSDRPIEVTDAERRLAGPGGHIATDTQMEAAATLSETAFICLNPLGAPRSHGAAQKASASQYGPRGSTPFDQPNVVTATTHLLADPDGGLSARASQGSVAAVTLSDPAIPALEPIEVSRGRGSAHAEISQQESPGAPTLSEPASGKMASVVSSRTRGGGQGRTRIQSVRAPAIKSRRAVHAANTESDTPDGGGSHTSSDSLLVSAAANQSHPADHAAFSKDALPEGGDGQRANGVPQGTAVAKKSRSAKVRAVPNEPMPSEGGGLCSAESQAGTAPAKPSRRAKKAVPSNEDTLGEGDGQSATDTHRSHAVATIVDLWRQRQQLRKTQGSLGLQAQSMCRRYLGGDKEAAAKAWSAIQKGRGDPDLAMIVQPYIDGMVPFELNAGKLEKQLAKLVRTLPIWTWANDVRGLGELSVAGLVGEASGNLGDYKSVSALWKRMGLAVIDGERQRRVAGADAALRHGYAPQRRAFAYVISCNLMKSQKAEHKYRAVYDRRKAYELEREIPKAHAHNRALRVMVKELLKDAWSADRRLRRVADEPEALAA